MYRPVIFLCALVALVKGQTTAVSQCTINRGELPINAYVEGCTNPPCQLPQDSDAIIHLVFRAPYTIRRMETLAVAQLIFVIPYPLGENSVTCNFLTNTYCPILAGEIVQYSLTMRIESVFPMVTLPIEFRIQDDNSNVIMCIRLSVSIVAPISRSNSTMSLN